MNMLRPLQEVIEGEQESLQRYILSLYEERRRQVESIEKHRRVYMDLCGVEGIRLEEWRYTLEIHLGERPRTKRGLREFGRKLQLVRESLGCPLKLHFRNLHDDKKRLVKVVLGCEEYPDLRVDFICKLGKTSRCKIVRKKVRYTDSNLVCEV